MRRRFEFHRRQKIRLRADFVLRRKLVFKPRLRADQSHAIAATRAHRDLSGEPSIRTRREWHRAAPLSLFDQQFGGLRGLVGLQLQLHLGAFEGNERALLFRHLALRQLAVVRVVKGLLKFRDEGPLARIEQILPRERIAGFHAIAHARAAHLHGRGEAIAAERLHVHHLPATSVAHRLDARAVCRLTGEFHDHAHRVALRHNAITSLGLVKNHFCPRDAFQICAGKKRAQQQRMKAPAARKHHAHRDAHDRHRIADGSPDECHGQQRLHFHTADASCDISLQQRAELLGVKNLPVRATKLDRRQQILAQPRLRVLDETRKLPLIRRMQELTQACTPRDDQHCQIGRAAQ